MNKRESAILSAYTGISFGGKLFSEFHAYVEEKFGHAVWTHEMCDNEFWIKLKKLSEKDFMDLANSIKD